MFKLYAASEDYACPVRVRHAVKTLVKAQTLARTLIASFVEIRESLPNGKERLVSIFNKGVMYEI